MVDPCISGELNHEIRSLLSEFNTMVQLKRGDLQRRRTHSLSDTEKVWIDEQILEIKDLESKSMGLIRELMDIPHC